MPISLGAVLRSSWRLCAFSFAFGFVNWGENDLVLSFARTLTHCDASAPPCPLGALNRSGACASVPRSSPDWSGSAHCFDHDLVVTRAQGLSGQLGSLNAATQVVALFLLGPRIDTSGRRGVMALGLLSFALSTALFCAAAFMDGGGSGSGRGGGGNGGGGGVTIAQTALLFPGVLLGSSLNCFLPAVQAMCSDLAAAEPTSDGDVVANARAGSGGGGDGDTRNTYFAAISLSRSAGVLSGFGAGFAVLRINLVSYRSVWLAVAAFSAAAAAACRLGLKETLPKEQAVQQQQQQQQQQQRQLGAPLLPPPSCEEGQSRDDDDHGGSRGGGRGRGGCWRVAQETREALILARRDRFLRHYLGITFLLLTALSGVIGCTGGFLLRTLKLTQSVASLAGVVQPAAMVLGLGAAPQLARRSSAAVVWLLGIGGVVLGFVGAGLSAVGPSPALFWPSWALAGAGFGLVTPCSLTLVSLRVAPREQGKLMSLLQLVALCGATIGVAVWTGALFKATGGAGWQAGGFYHISAALLLGCMAWFAAVARTERLLVAGGKHAGVVTAAASRRCSRSTTFA